ncbi:hypothetical protein HYU91_00735 [Candidatus Collierbacteria bacterium]|nr:hypothetical protein [Candidatus Collierbacteria bacterium]
MSLPTDNEIKTLSNSTKSLRSFAKYIFLVLLSGVPTWVGVNNSKKLDSIIQLQQTQTQNQAQSNTNNIFPNQQQSPIPKTSETLGLNTDFNISEWFSESYTSRDDFLCSLDNKNNYWSIWSIKKYQLSDNELSAKIILKANPNKHQTFVVSMGEYKPKYNPKTIFQLNIFEGDYKTIRIYGSDTRNPKGQDWMDSEPDLSKDVKLLITTKSPNARSSILLVSVSIEYYSKDDNKPKTYILSKAFEIDTEFTSVEDGVKAQLGLGISKGGCFKVSSVDVKK